MSPIQRIQKDRDNKMPKQQFNSLKEKEESMVAWLEPLQEAATILSQVLTDRKLELTSIIKETEAKMEEPLSEHMIVEVQERGGQATMVVVQCKEWYAKLR